MDSPMNKLMFGNAETRKEALFVMEHDHKLYMDAMFSPTKTKFFVKELIVPPTQGEVRFLGHMVDIKQLI